MAKASAVGEELSKSSGVVEGGMSIRNEQRKHGTSRGSPRRTSTAKASRINRNEVKSGCTCEWNG